MAKSSAVKVATKKATKEEKAKAVAGKADVLNFKNETVGQIELPENLFSARWRPALVKQVVEAQLANRRVPWAHAKDRSEVSGGGRKPWRQKGTGRARHGSTRSPIWVGGGKAHGPLKTRDYSQKVNKQMKRGALAAVLSRKFKDGEIKFIESFETEPKTKALVSNLKGLFSAKTKKFDLVIVPDMENKNILRAASNLEKTKVLNPESLNVYDLLSHKNVFIDQKAVAVIGKHFNL